MTFLPALQYLNEYNKVWMCLRNLVGPEVMFLLNPELTIKVANLLIFFPSLTKEMHIEGFRVISRSLQELEIAF